MGRMKTEVKSTHTHTQLSAKNRLAGASGPDAAPPRKLRSQSAMEYLMTYGWAILIIAVVLGALFSLGVFNGANFAPKAPPGACQVFRPNGPGSTNFINLEGVCSGELPQYVASFAGVASSNITATSTGLPVGSAARTVTAWIYTEATEGNLGAVAWGTSGINDGVSGVGIFPSDTVHFWGDNDDFQSAFIVPAKTWTFIAASYVAGANTITLYEDSNSQTGSLSASVALNTPSGTPLKIGVSPDNNWNFNGSIANVQIYNTSLSGPEVNALYLEGIGGAPIDLQNLVGWWPLNGNANDYSGNMNNGVPNNVVYTSSWESGYTAP